MSGKGWKNLIKRVDKKRVRCPCCGYLMPLFYDETSNCDTIEVKCKGRRCGKIIRVKIVDGVQIR